MKTRLLGLLLKDFTTLIKGDNRKSCYRLFLFKPNKKVTVLGAVMGLAESGAVLPPVYLPNQRLTLLRNGMVYSSERPNYLWLN